MTEERRPNIIVDEECTFCQSSVPRETTQTTPEPSPPRARGRICLRVRAVSTCRTEVLSGLAWPPPVRSPPCRTPRRSSARAGGLSNDNPDSLPSQRISRQVFCPLLAVLASTQKMAGTCPAQSLGPRILLWRATVFAPPGNCRTWRPDIPSASSWSTVTIGDTATHERRAPSASEVLATVIGYTCAIGPDISGQGTEAVSGRGAHGSPSSLA